MVMQPELKLRVVSAVILGIAVLLLTFYGGTPFRLMAAAFALLIHYEWTTITRVKAESPLALNVSWVFLFLISVATVVGAGEWGVGLIVSGALVVAMLAWRGGVKPTYAILLGLGVVYSGFSGLALAEIRDDARTGLVATAFLFAVVWATDIFAYFCGRAIGGRKLAPRISPGKTWSGAVFGMFAGIAAGTLVAIFAFERGGLWIPLLAGILSVASQVGDLFESWLKRRFQVKDSGRIIPGHGGVMDRVDGLVFAAFAAFLIAVTLSGSIPSVGGGMPIAVSLFGL